MLEAECNSNMLPATAIVLFQTASAQLEFHLACARARAHAHNFLTNLNAGQREPEILKHQLVRANTLWIKQIIYRTIPNTGNVLRAF